MTHIRALSAADRRGRARPARRRKKPNRTAAHNSHSAPSSRGAGSPPSASARPAPRSPDSARGANPPNAPARGGGKQSRPARQGKRFSARPSAFGGFGALAAPAVGGGFGAGNDIAAVRRSGRVIFSAISYYRKTSGREFPECTGKGAGRPAPHGGAGKAFFRPPVGIRRVRANAPALRRRRGIRRPPPCPGKARRARSPRSPIISLRRCQSAVSPSPPRLPSPHHANTKAYSRYCFSH